ncbi:Zn-ribbon domain-containing OB-fold protein [Peterkaempfera bronchialis]|uniref:Zn-ribbon domain-containing OB-fold protein n=1 Tax=Peterkaempfera bronchialis TaxID=2126346 RepID=UPI003C2F1125
MSHDTREADIGAAASSVSPWTAYRAGLADGRLLYQRCTACTRAQFYPRVLCAHCGGTALSWQQSAGAGVVHATSSVPERDAAPRNVALVDLDEGFRMMSRVTGAPSESVRIGAAVRARIVDEDGEPVVVFELRSAA